MTQLAIIKYVTDIGYIGLPDARKCVHERAT